MSDPEMMELVLKQMQNANAHAHTDHRCAHTLTQITDQTHTQITDHTRTQITHSHTHTDHTDHRSHKNHTDEEF